MHVVYFSNENQTDLYSKLDYYRSNPLEGQKVARAGYLHAMKYHRTVSLVDYVLRSAHLKRAKLLGLRPLPRYRYTAQFLNHQTVKQQQDIKKNDRPGAYHHAHLDHHDHSLVKHHAEHHGVIHAHKEGLGLTVPKESSSKGPGYFPFLFGGGVGGNIPADSAKQLYNAKQLYKPKRNPLLANYPSLT